MELWLGERADAAEKLKIMDQFCCLGLLEEAPQLRDMIGRYGTDWVEPMNRLALLLFTKGTVPRLTEATDLCHSVLRVKPWHFETAQLLVILLLQQGHFRQAVDENIAFHPSTTEPTTSGEGSGWRNIWRTHGIGFDVRNWPPRPPCRRSVGRLVQSH